MRGVGLAMAGLGTVRARDGVVSVELRGPLDLAAAKSLRDEVDDVIDRFPASDVTLDLRGVEFIDSSGLGLILGRYRRLTASGRQLRLTGVRGGVDKVLRLSGFHGIMGIDALPEEMGPRTGS